MQPTCPTRTEAHKRANISVDVHNGDPVRVPVGQMAGRNSMAPTIAHHWCWDHSAGWCQVVDRISEAQQARTG